MAKRSLLLVDGDSKSLRVLEVSLKKAGFNVLTASTGSEALEKSKSSRVDLVISDTDLPEMDGYDFCREFKKSADCGEIPFIFLTSQTAIENKIRGLELGVDDYLTKPIYIKEILTRVRILLQKRDRASFEQKKDTNTRFAGRLVDMGVIDLIQTIEVSRKTGLIHFRADEKRQATIFFKEGRVIDAEAGHLQGEDAVYRLLTWNEGDFEALFRPVRRKPVIEMSAQALLMEGMRRLDEWGRMQEQLPALGQKFEVVYDELWDRLSELPDEVNQILRLFDARRSLEEVIDGANIGDLEAVEIISKLYFEGIIVEAGAGLGSGNFALEDLKIPRPHTKAPGDIEDTDPDATAPTSEDFGDETSFGDALDDKPDTGATSGSDSADLAAAAAAAVATAKSTKQSKSASQSKSSDLSGLVSKAIGEATPLDTSARPVAKKPITSPRIAVAQIALKKQATTIEQRLAKNLIKKANPKSTTKKGRTQPMATVPLPPAAASPSKETEADTGASDAPADVAALKTKPREDAAKKRETAKQPAEKKASVDAVVAADDDVTAIPKAVEDTDSRGIISADRSRNNIVSGSVASKAKLSKKGEPGAKEKRRAVPPISSHDSDVDDEPSGFSPWLAVGLVAAAALTFVVVQSMGSDSSSDTKDTQVGLTDTGSRVVVPLVPPPLASPDASTTTANSTRILDAGALVAVADAAIVTQPPDAAVQTKPPTVPAVTSKEEQLKVLLSGARKAKRQGDKLEALQLIDEALEIRKSTSALLLKAETLLAVGDSKAALQVATELTAAAPRRSQAWRIRGLAAYEQKDYAQARTSFDRYLELKPNASDAADVQALLDSL